MLAFGCINIKIQIQNFFPRNVAVIVSCSRFLFQKLTFILRRVHPLFAWSDLLAVGLHALIGAVLGLVLALMYPGHQLLATGLPPLPDLASDQVRVTDRLLQLNWLQIQRE